MATRNKLYLVSFIEGATVMVVELCAAKLLAPYFGTSVQVWAATIGVTMAGLAGGYFLGAKLVQRSNIEATLRLILVFVSMLIILYPMISFFVMEKLVYMSLFVGVLLSLLITLFPILVLLGITSPMIIGLLSNHNKSAGTIAGVVYGISTLGGIIMTLLTGFYMIPYLGIRSTMLISGIVLLITSLVTLVGSTKSTSISLLALIVPLMLTFNFDKELNPYFKVLFESDGLLGNIKIIEHQSDGLGKSGLLGRGLVVNNTLQTFMDVKDPFHSSIWAWSNIIPSALSVYKSNTTKVLLCGLGGATIVKQLNLLGFKDYDIVELDSRIYSLARKYFDLGNSANVIIDDARHFIRKNNKKYDVILFDTFLSESAPEHLLTVESLRQVKEDLTDQGMLMTNFYGFTSGELGYAARSVIRTYIEAGFKTQVIATPGDENGRNILIVGSINDIDFSDVSYEETDGMHITDISGLLLDLKSLDLKHAEILRDNNPKLSKLYSNVSMMWKKGYNNYYTKNLYK